MNDSLKILIVEKNRETSSRIETLLKSFVPEMDQIKIWDEQNELFHSVLDYVLIILGPSFSIDDNIQRIQNIKIINPQVTIIWTYESTQLNGQDITSPFAGVHRYQPDLDQKNFQSVIEQALTERKDCHLWKDIPIIIGNSRQINEVRKKIKEVAQKDITVLITGETGTGKELIARSMHFYSKRKNGPLIKINCGSLPDDLLESEVFGFQKGAFTGAHRDKPGRFELSHQGTLFIDEIGNLSLPLQAKFLQVLEEKSFSRLGGTEDQTVDTRVVAATNSDLSTMVREGTFRKDLFFRLNILNIKAWPLRELKEDIPFMVQYFIDKFCFELKRDTIEVPDETMALMQAYPWPGNVRELENAVRRAIVYKSWDFFTEEMSKRQMEMQGNETNSQLAFEKAYGDLGNFFKDNNYLLKQIRKNYVAKVEKEAILKSLQATDWNRRQAAKLLGVSYKTLLNRITELELSK